MAGTGESTTGAPREPQTTVDVSLQWGRDGAPRVAIQVVVEQETAGKRPAKPLLLTQDQAADLRRQLAAADLELQRLAAPTESGAIGKLLPFPHIRRPKSKPAIE
ncbi:MAG: hypothetical protein NTZ05_21155 [Chloroflexi bacterium]|nr:hypothetical protein [Chloroflexota bacterium]